MREKDKEDRDQIDREARSFVRSLWKTAARQWREDERAERSEAIRFALRQVCSNNSEEMSVVARSFYMTKAVFCCFMDWREENLWFASSDSCVDSVALWSGRFNRVYSGKRRWKELKVGRGILSGWNFEITEDID